MRCRWTPLIGLLLAVALGCDSADDDTETASTRPNDTWSPATDVGEVEPWGEPALAWLDALETAAINGTRHLEPFLAADLVWDNRIGAELIEGEDDWLDRHLTDDLYWVFLPRGTATYFVSADQVVGQRIVGYDPPISWLDRMTIGPDGLRHWIRAGSLDAGRFYQPRRVEFDALDDLADRYVSSWNGDDLDAAMLYTSDATIEDTLLGESLSGLTEIERTMATGAWPAIGRISIVDLPEGAGRAVHHAPSDEPWMGSEEVGLMIEADDGSGCPGLMAVVLSLDGDRVRSEQRFHAIESVRRCEDATALETGWWEGIHIPASVVVERSGTVEYGDMEIEVFEGTPALHAFIEWGLTRFDDAGLGAPRVASVTFLDGRVNCYNVGGESFSTDHGAEITLCRTADDICVDDACEIWRDRDLQLWLHELAHQWLNEHTDDAIRAEFLELTGVERWSDPQAPWQERGVELAADAVAYGLMDDPVDLSPEVALDCEDRLAAFRFLTDTDPIATCPDR